MILQWSALFPVVLTLVATQPSVPRIITNICYTKWALEAFVIVNAERCASIILSFLSVMQYSQECEDREFKLMLFDISVAGKDPRHTSIPQCSHPICLLFLKMKCASAVSHQTANAEGCNLTLCRGRCNLCLVSPSPFPFPALTTSGLLK